MTTRSILVFFPAIPFDMSSLLPSERIACLAGGLLDAGHETRILDYGTVPVFSRLYPKSVRNAAQVVAGCLFGAPSAGSVATLSALVRLRKIEQMRARRAANLYGETAAELVREATSTQSDFIAFHVEDERAFEGVLTIARQVRAFLPSIRLALAGPFVEADGSRLATYTEPFNVLCAWSPESTLVQWAEQFNRPETWSLIPNLIVPGSAIKIERGPSVNVLPPACYDSDIYPAAANGSKFRLLSVQSSRFCEARSPGELDNEWNGDIETKSPRLLAEELSACMSQWKCHAFHFVEAAPSANHVAAIAREIIGHGIQCVYSGDGPASGLNSGIFSLLRASGCRAMQFSIDTGSQWLLDDYYGRDLSVSETEHMLRACRHADIFTVARFAYPCPVDDYHTRAETVRLIMRARPQSVLVRLPEALANPKRHEEPAKPRPELYERTFMRKMAPAKFVLPWRSHATGGARDARPQGAADRDELVREIEQMGISTSVTPQLALVANSAGYAGHEQDFATILNKSFFLGDATGIASAIKQFNTQIARRAQAVSPGDFAPLLAVVGN